MFKIQRFSEQNFVPELLGKCETGLPSAGATTNELIAKHVHLVRSPHFIPESVFYAQSVVLSPQPTVHSLPRESTVRSPQSLG